MIKKGNTIIEILAELLVVVNLLPLSRCGENVYSVYYRILNWYTIFFFFTELAQWADLV